MTSCVRTPASNWVQHVWKVCGFTTWAKKDRIRIIRQAGAKPREFVFNYLDYAAGKKLEENIVLVPGDVVVVPE